MSKPCRYCPNPGRFYPSGWLCADHAPPPQPEPGCVAPARCYCPKHLGGAA